MKSTLCLLMALVCNVAWAQPAISDAPANGEWAQKTTWFRIETGDDYSYRADDLTATGYLALTNKVDAKSDVALWCIVGDAEKGYHFYNRAKGAAVVLGMKDGYAEFVAAGTSGYITAFDFVQSQKTGNTYWCAKEHGSANNFLNRKNSGDYHLQFWNSSAASGTDNGSAMLFTEVDLSTLTNSYASESDITATQELIKDKDAPGYPKRTSAQYRMLNEMLKIGQGIIKTDLDAAVLAYKTCTDIILPEDGKAYTIANYTKTGITRYLTYKAGEAMSVKTIEGDEKPSVFVCRELSAGVYAFVTVDGKVLTWMGGDNGFTAEGSRKGYSTEYGMEQDGLYDWNKITVKSNKNTNDGTDFGLLRLVARRSSSYPSASWVINVGNGTWNHNGSDAYNFNENHSSAWIITEVEHTNTDAQEWALAKITAKSQIESMKLGSYCLVDKSSNKLTNLKTAFDAVNAAENQGEINALLATRALDLPTSGKAYYLKDSQGTYLDIHHLVVEANDAQNSTQLASLSKTKQILYITGSETDGTWKIHTTPEGGKYLHQKTSSNRTWNSWVSDAGGDFKWEVEGVDVSGTPHYMLKNISGKENGILGPNNSSHTNAGEPLFVNQKVDANKLKMQLLPVKSITGLASTAGEWLNEECVNVATVDEIPQGIKNLSNYNNFVNAEYTQKVITSGEHFYINAGRLTGLFSWHSGSGSKRVNIVAVEVVDLAGTVVAADYHWGYAGNPSSNNTYSVDVPEDGLYYLRYYAETASNGGVNNSDVDITYTLIEKNVDSVEEFVEGGIYTFITKRGWMGAHQDYTTVISTKKITNNDPAPSDENPNFQWTMYKSSKGNYYLYNIGKEQFMGVESSNNTSVPFTATPSGKDLTFKVSNTADYPIMFSTDNKGVVNHTGSYGNGLVTWTGGWDVLNDEGSNHKVTLVGMMEQSKLNTLKELVERFDQQLPVNYQVEMSENNPNTHFGSVKATSSIVTFTTKLKKNTGVVMLDYDGINETTIDFTREYRGFEFKGFYLGEEELGKSFTLTDDQKTAITEANPLIAKFDTTEAVTLFYDDDEFSYRIPAIATTSTGRLIAVSDYRYSLDDIGRYNFGTANPGIDLVIRISDDNGKTWGATKTIAKGSCVRGTDDCAYGDAAIAVVGQKVLVMGAAGDVMFGNGSATAHNRTVRILSEDNGVTWTAPQDISETFFINADATINSAYSLFFGSGKLAVDENYNGTGNARIYGAVLVKKNGIGNAIYVVYTDDFGLTWSILGGSQTHITANDEPKVEILPSGQILLSVRRGGGRQFNVFTYTDKATNAGSWKSNVDGCSNGGSNTCNGEIFLVEAKKADGTMTKLLLQSQPKGGGNLYDRRDVTIWYKEITDATYTSSEIAGNWIEGLQVSTQQSAYSTMSLQKDGKIAFFFEEAPCYGDDQAKGYCMVYMPLTIENITKGNYFSEDADLSAERTINVVLTDAEGNEYRDQVLSGLTGVADAITEKYAFITLGNQAGFIVENGSYTYTNSVTLPFKVSNAETTVWHNIYWPSNTGAAYPIYLSASASGDTYVGKVTEQQAYGNSSSNTAANAAKIGWAVYNVDNSFTFKFKNQLTGKFIQVSSVADGDNQNVKYVAEAEATAFELVPDAASYNGDYALKAVIGGTTGYLCSTSAGYGYATHYKGTGHQGAWLKFVEAPDYEELIASITVPLASGMYGDGLGQYKPTGDTNLAAIRTAMESSSSVKLNTLNSYKDLLDAATLNMPQSGQYFRIRGISGNYIDATSIYGNANATTGQMSMKSASTCNYKGTIFYLDENNRLLNYATGTYTKQTSHIGEVDDADKAVWTISESPRKGGKYALRNTVTSGQNGQFLHDSEGSRADRCGKNCGDRHDFTLEEVTALPFTISDKGYGTLYAPVALKIPEHVKAYTGVLSSENGETVLDLTKITTRVIPAGTGVVLYRDKDTYGPAAAPTSHDFVITTTTETADGNVLEGNVATIARTSVQGEAYTLQADTKSPIGVAFKPSADNIASGKAYLVMPSQQQAQVFRIRFAGTTEIEGSELKAQGSQLIYDLQGRRVLNPTKGVYVVNGKKVIF